MVGLRGTCYHVAPPTNPPLFACLYSFLTRFSRQLLEAFWCSKWVIRGTVGNLEKSTFQRYKVCMNWSLDGKVITPGSRGVRAVFLHFSGEDSDQLVASWEESAYEGGCPGGKTHQIFITFSLFSSVFTRTVDVAPDVDFQQSWCPWKACDTLFLKVPDLRKVELGSGRCGHANGGRRSVISSPEGYFPIEILAKPGKILAIPELHVMSEHVLFLKVLDLRIKSQQVGKNLCAKATSPGENYEIFSIVSFLLSIFLRTVDMAPNVVFSTILVSLKSLQ
uniref:Uncharacterized protein n=1 Tax=Fagus sylvatica TaxID=28930 RepID=A0A2N9EZU0_FAGSY